jgi:hypothetical protein
MANDRETKSYEAKPERPQDTSAAIRANDGETMGGGRDADLRPHKEAGSSGTGVPPMPDNEMTISARDGIRETKPRRKPGADDER